MDGRYLARSATACVMVLVTGGCVLQKSPTTPEVSASSRPDVGIEPGPDEPSLPELNALAEAARELASIGQAREFGPKIEIRDIEEPEEVGELGPPAPGPALVEPEAVPESLDSHIAGLVSQLATALDQKARDETLAFEAFRDLVLLETQHPGLLDDLDDPDSPLTDVLAPDEIRALQALRVLSAGLRDTPDASRLAELFAESRLTLGDAVPLRVSRAELCSRVAGFGLFTPFETTTFVSRRAHPAIVYVEVDHFVHRQASEAEDLPGGWSVELTQTLELRTVADGTLVWQLGPDTDKSVSLNRRRDYYLTNRIELPATLTVGSYMLKVIMRDEATGAEASAVIPVNIVADRALTRAGD